MHTNEVRLGICFFENRLFYAVKNTAQKSTLEHIGSLDFSFSISQALLERRNKNILNLRNAVKSLEKRFSSSQLHLLLNPRQECWSVLPKLVYDNPEEREAHINILMHGVDRENIHASWHPLSKEKFKLLNLRTSKSLEGIKQITNGHSSIHLQSVFEIGEKWIGHKQPGGSFLTLCCYHNCIAVSSYLLGKLRGTTYICFDQPEDLPYLWLQQSQMHKWMRGLHEQIQVFGTSSSEISKILSPFFDDPQSVVKMNALEKMEVSAREETYGFDLCYAYPAIMMVL